jgi:hypothetical protein
MHDLILYYVSPKLSNIFNQPMNETNMPQLVMFSALELSEIMWSFRGRERISAKLESLVNITHYKAIRMLWSYQVDSTPNPEVIYPARNIVETNISRREVAVLSIPSTQWTAYTFIYISCYTCCGPLHNLLLLCGQVWLKLLLQSKTIVFHFRLSEFPVHPTNLKVLNSKRVLIRRNWN